MTNKLISPTQLEVIAVFGFDGHVPAGIKIHPDQIHVCFPLGNKITVLNMNTNKEEFLSGHSHSVTTLAISESGKLLGSGQKNHMGFRAYVIVWDWPTRTEIMRHELHKVEVQSLCFSVKEDFIISLGGRDCGTIVIWNLVKRAALCGAFAIKETTGYAKRIISLQQSNGVFLTCGEKNLRIWTIDQINSKLTVHDTSLGKLRREFTSMCISPDDEVIYLGTMSGDIVKVRLNSHPVPPVLLGCFARHRPNKPVGKDCEKYENGVREILILPEVGLAVGAGDGTVDIVVERNVQMKEYSSPTWPMLRSVKSIKVSGAVTSLQLYRGNTLVIGTDLCEIYRFSLENYDLKLLKTCHTNKINDIAFPYQLSLVFATASHESIRIWSTTKLQELLRIVVPNFICAAVLFSRDGKSIVSAWNDGAIRGFTPLSGKLIYAIPNAHNKGCSAIAMTSNCRILVSAGCEGQVRVWKIEPHRQELIGVLKEHAHGPVMSVDINIFDNEVITAATDGICVIWDLIHLCRKQVIYGQSQFICAKYHPTAVQILSAGADRKLCYWEIYNGEKIREITASKSGPINAIDIFLTGDYFVTGGSHQQVNLWNYKRGEIECVGVGHAGAVTTVKISPCGKFVVSGGADGAVFMWRVPQNLLSDRPPENPLDKCCAKLKECTIAARKPRTRPNLTINENIRELEKSRSNLSSRISKCPSIDNVCASV